MNIRYIYIYSIYIKEFRFNLTHWKQKSYFLKITSFRWPPFCSGHSLSLLRTLPTTLWSISTGIRLTSCWIWCFNSWSVGCWSFEDLRFQIPPEKEITCLKIRWPGWPCDVRISGDMVREQIPHSCHGICVVWLVASSCWKNVSSVTGWRVSSRPKKFSNMWT